MFRRKREGYLAPWERVCLCWRRASEWRWAFFIGGLLLVGREGSRCHGVMRVEHGVSLQNRESHDVGVPRPTVSVPPGTCEGAGLITAQTLAWPRSVRPLGLHVVRGLLAAAWESRDTASKPPITFTLLPHLLVCGRRPRLQTFPEMGRHHHSRTLGTRTEPQTGERLTAQQNAPRAQ